VESSHRAPKEGGTHTKRMGDLSGSLGSLKALPPSDDVRSGNNAELPRLGNAGELA